MADYYISEYTGSEMDEADDRSLGPDATPTAGSANLVESGGVYAAIEDVAENSAPAITETASGAVASFPDGSGKPMLSLVADITAVQEGSGTPAPDNVRAITGFTGVNVTVATDEQSSGDTYAVSWQDEAGTVYGGTVDVTTGVLTVTHILTTFDGSADENWLFNTVDASRNRMSIALPSVKMPPSYSDDYIANWLGPSLASSPQVWLASYTNQGLLRVGVPTTIASVSDWQTYLSNNPLDIVYPIATPQTYQLTPTEVNALLGINNVWADTGDVTVEYRADTGLFIAERLPEPPSADGTYTLTVTVSGGSATYSWA